MIEIGKKDILDRNSLAMEPFDRNISFRAVDMSHERAPDHLVHRYEFISQLFVDPSTKQVLTDSSRDCSNS